jgi:protein TonB
MEQNIPSWRHLFAFLVTVAGMYGALRLSQIQPAPTPPPLPVMHIRMMEPPPPPPPPPQKPSPVRTVAPAPAPKAVRAPVKSEPNPTVAAPAAAPVAAAPAAPATPPAAVTSPAPPAPVTSASVEAAYVARLRSAVEAQKHYPTSKDAMLQQPRGTVSVWILLDRKGTLIDAGIDQSRGSLLNQAALQSVHRASYPAFPAEIYAGETQHRFVVSLDYAPQ